MTAPQACEKWTERVSAYADGECRLFERMLVRLHLRECARCRDWLEQVRADEQAFRAAYLGDDDAEDLTDAVMARVGRESQAQQRSAKRRVSGGQRLIEVMVAFGMLAVLAAILFPTFAKAREKARQPACLSNMKQLAVATQMFAQDHQDRLPGVVTWHDDVLPYVQNEQLFQCPAQMPDDSPDYAINPLVAGRDLTDIDDHERTVLLYEVDRTGQPVFPHNDGANYAFVDGHTKWLSKRDAPEDLQTTGFAPPTQSYGIAERLKLAYTASVDLIVENLYAAVLQAEAAVHEYGGFILSSQLDGESGFASLTVKVPTPEVGNVINALGTLGFVAHREVSGEDLTQGYVAAQRQVAAAGEREQRLEGMVREMADDEQRVAAEANLGAVEAETTQAQDQTWEIDARTTLATISATLRQGAREPQPTGVIASFIAAGRSFWQVLRGLGSVAAWVIVFLPIWGGAFALAWLGLRRLVRPEESVMAEQRSRFSCWRVLGWTLLIAAVPLAWAVRSGVLARAVHPPNHPPVPCAHHLRILCLGVAMYAQDYDNVMPPTARWAERVWPYVRDDDIFLCPKAVDGTWPSYALSPALAATPVGRSLDAIRPPAVMLYDGRDGMVIERHRGGANYGYTDEHVEWHEEPPPGLHLMRPSEEPSMGAG